MGLFEFLMRFLPDRCRMPGCTRHGVRGRERGVGAPWVLILHPDATERKRPATGWAAGEIVERDCPNCGYSWPTEHRSTRKADL